MRAPRATCVSSAGIHCRDGLTIPRGLGLRLTTDGRAAATASRCRGDALPALRPCRAPFRGWVGGHASALAVARDAREREVKRLAFAHIGRPTIRAIDAGTRPPFGEFGDDGRCYRLRADS
jgi:hypothetical protein